jgi:hypothetical protein
MGLKGIKMSLEVWVRESRALYTIISESSKE